MPKSTPKPAIIIYGIPNCDTMKKARTWLDGQGIAYRFHDYRAEGIDRSHVAAWVKALGWEKVLNKASTTFKDLPESDKAGLDAKKAVALMLANPTMIKRPMLDLGGRLIAGFKPDIYAEAFGG
jgi:arsenate reductase